MGLLLRPDAYYAESPDGMYVLTHHGPLSFTGRTAFHLLHRLAPLLDGSHDLDRLTADLDPDRHAAVAKLVTSLVDRGVIREIDDDPATGGHDGPLFTYFMPSGAAAFDEYRNRTTLVLAGQPWRESIVTAAGRAGLLDIRVAGVVDDVDDRLDDVDLVLHAFDGAGAEGALALDQMCAERGIRAAYVMHDGGRAWIGHSAPDERGGWSSGWLRLRAHGTEPADAEPPSAFATTVVAAQLVRGTTAPAQAMADRLTVVDLSSGGSETVAFLPHPFTRRSVRTSRSDGLTRLAELRHGRRLTDEEFSKRAVACRGDRLGVFTAPTERDFTQIPLQVCEVDVSDPAGLRGGTARVTGAGIDFSAARHSAAMRALARYAWGMLDPRRISVADGSLPADPFDALDALRTGNAVGYVYGYRLTDDEPQLVDAAHAFGLGDTTAAPLPPAGVATGYDWDEAVAAGLIAHAQRVTASEIPTAAAPFARIDPAGVDIGPVGTRCIGSLEATGEHVSVYDVTGSLGVPTVICCLDHAPAGCASGLDLGEAVSGALFQALLRHQSHENGQPEYAPPPCPGLPGELRGQLRRQPIDHARTGAGVAAAFADRGTAPIAIPLDHDAEVFAVLPFIANVVVPDA